LSSVHGQNTDSSGETSSSPSDGVLVGIETPYRVLLASSQADLRAREWLMSKRHGGSDRQANPR
jgi:hypothetical protein